MTGGRRHFSNLARLGARLLAGCLALLAIAATARPVAAFSIEFQGRGVKRTVLALYDSAVEAAPSSTRIHKAAEMPLNHLGYVLHYHDVRTPLPPLAEARKYRGVITWFIDDLPDPAAYVDWLEGVTAAGVKLVALGEIAPKEASELVPRINRILARIGLRSADNFQELTFKAKATFIDAGHDRLRTQARQGDPGLPRHRAGDRRH